MDNLTINFEGDTVTVTNGKKTSISIFNNIVDNDKKAFVALADFFGYEPEYLLNFDNDENLKEEF